MQWEDSPGSGVHPNLAKFLGFLGKAEGADYNTIVGGSSFNDFSKHPGVVGLRTKEGPSTAAGRYQITKTTYNDVAPQLGITDFTNQSQDLIATELIRRKGALEDVISGNFDNAVNKLGGTWASLPSSPYSQPKRDWNFVKANLKAESGWEDAPSASAAASGGGWEDAPTAAPVGRPQPAPAAAAPVVAQAAPKPSAPAQPAPSRMQLLGQAAQGVGDTLTFGYLDELAGKAANLVGRDGKAVTEALRQNAKDAGPAYTAGQLGGAFVPGLGTLGAIRAVPTASRLIRAGAGLASGAVQGGLYGSGSAEEGQRLEGAAIGGATGAALGGALGSVIPASLKQKTTSFIKKSGDDAAAKVDAEIITDIKKLSDSSTKRGNPVTAIDVNAVEGKYINEVNRAIGSLGKVDKTFDAAPLKAAIQDRRALTPDDLAPLRTTKAGEAVADAIEKAQRARSMTQALQSSGGILPMIREGVDYLPIPAGVNRGLKALLGGRQTREVAAQNALKQAGVADEVLAKLGPSDATKSMKSLGGLVTTAQNTQAAKVAAGQQTRAASQAGRQAATDAAEQLRIRNLELGVRSKPGFTPDNLKITGGTRGTLQYYGRLADSKELAKGLRMIEKTDPYLKPYVDAIKQNKTVPNGDLLLGLTDRLQLLRDQGVLKPFMKKP